MFVPVRMTTNGEAVYSTGFDMIESKARDMAVPLTLIGERLLFGVGKQFTTEGAWGLHQWPPLKPEYAAWKEHHGPGLTMLVGLRPVGRVGTREHPIYGKHYVPSGKMRAELLDPASLSVTPERLLYAPVSDIAGFHQSGTPKMPARPPVSIPLDELHEYDRIFVAWLNGILTEANL